MSYDTECKVLAEHFLSDEPSATAADADSLAQAIQEAVEDWFTTREGPPPSKKLGFAAAVREYGDAWRQAGFGWNGESYRGLSPHTMIALSSCTQDADDQHHMANCSRYGRLFQVSS
jgi:hypothetical protein